MYPGAAIDPVTIVMHAADLGFKFSVVDGSRAWFPGKPCIEATTRDFVAPTQETDCVFAALFGYELEFRLRRSRLKRMAFFKRSFSTRSAS
jgi:hypothetical protein